MKGREEPIDEKRFMKFDQSCARDTTNASENVYSFNATQKYCAIVDWNTEL